MNASQTVSCKPNPEKERARGYLEESIPDSRFKVTRWGGAGGGRKCCCSRCCREASLAGVEQRSGTCDQRGAGTG